MSQFEWLLTVAAYFFVAGIVLADVLFIAYLRRRPASSGSGENAGELLNIMILLQTIRDILDDQKTLACQFNENFEQKLAHMDEKNRAAREQADNLEQKAVKLESRLQRVREELAVLHGQIEVISHGVAQERGPGPLQFSQGSGVRGQTSSAAGSSEEHSVGSNAAQPPSRSWAAASGETSEQTSFGSAPKEPQPDEEKEQAKERAGKPDTVELDKREDLDKPERMAPLCDTENETYSDETLSSAELSGTSTSRLDPKKGVEPVEPPESQASPHSRHGKAEESVNQVDNRETPVKFGEAKADTPSNDDRTVSHADGGSCWEGPARPAAGGDRPACQILASPSEQEEDEAAPPGYEDAPDYWVGLGFTGQSQESAYSGSEQEHTPHEPGDPEAARAAFRTLLNMGRESGAEVASRTETLDQAQGGANGDEGGLGPLRSRVYEYNDAGMNIAQIASELGIGKGEVRLILSLREQGGR